MQDTKAERSSLIDVFLLPIHYLARHPWRAMAIMAIVAVLSGLFSSRLLFESSYLALLPESSPEVQAIASVRKHTGGTSELVVAVGGDKKGRLPFAERLVKALNKRPSVQWAQVQFPVDFFQEGGLLLLPLETLETLHQRLAHAIADGRRKANPLMMDFDDEDDASFAGASGGNSGIVAGLQKEIERRVGHGLRRTRTTADGRYLLVLVRPKAASSELGQGQTVLADIQSVIAAQRRAHDGLEVKLGGSLMVNQAEHHTMSADLTLASGLALLLAVGLLTLVTRRLGTLIVIGAPLVLGLMVTLGMAQLLIGHLNLVSGFMVAALIGLGVDFGIHLYLRFLDERALDPSGSAEAAMTRSIDGTFKPCLTAALTTAAAFFALMVADFRGFSEYGLIAGMGVLVMLAVTFTALPAVALLLSRRAGGLDRVGRKRLSNTRPLARPLAWSMVAAGFAFAAFSVANVADLKFYNNFKQLKGTSAAVAFDDYLTREMGGSLSPALWMVDGLENARRTESIIQRRISEAGPHGPAMRALSLAALMPKTGPVRQELLIRTRQLAHEALVLGELKTEDALVLRQLYEATAVEPWDEAAVPAFFQSRLVARSAGANKYFVLVWPRTGLEDDLRIAAWAAELKEIGAQLSEAGISAQVLDENLIAARVVSMIRADGPRVMVVAAIAVFLILLFDLRRFDRVLLVASGVVIGLTAMLGVMVTFGLHLNLFNAVVLPTVLGIGIDNAVHLMHAYRERGRGSIPLVVATSGRAALLSSATTGIGFGSAIVAHHLGLHQMGLLALIGVGTTFLTSTIVLPAVLRVFESPDGTAELDDALDAETLRLPALPRPSNMPHGATTGRLARSAR